jgi:hypothetical protein
MDEPRPAVKEENERLRRLQLMVHLTMSLIHQSSTTLEEALEHVEATRQFALKLFPGKERAWEMIYKPRFNRVLRSRWGYVRDRPDDMVS